MINKFNLIFVTFFGIGKIKIIPGTFGSLVITILLFCFLHILFIPLNIILFVLVIIFLYSFYAINNYTKNLSNKDPREIVIDEVIGQSIPLYLYEISHNTTKVFTEALIFYFIIFLLFRFFDIIKPFPVSYFDKNFKNSFGVIFDDVFSGLYVVLILIFYMLGINYLF